MSQSPAASSAERRLRILRFGLIVVTAVAFALATGLGFFGAQGAIGGALMQGVLWGALVAVASVIIYFVYKSVVLKS